MGIIRSFTHPELRADSGLSSSSAHFQGLVSASAANMLKQVIDEVEPAGGVEQNRSVWLCMCQCVRGQH